ncbi:MAG: hypothetical protein C4589_09170 [Peptococcaceae bacterium]|nr:MAG: hypothetical protein C4589_09170 [Peptococcaceae bacterium]
MRFLIDEDLPRSMVRELNAAGYYADDIRDLGLRGQSDDKIYNYAQKIGAVLITADLGFANILRFPVGSNKGIILLRIPNEVSIKIVNKKLIDALTELSNEDISGNLVIIDMNKIRIKKPGI